MAHERQETGVWTPINEYGFTLPMIGQLAIWGDNTRVCTSPSSPYVACSHDVLSQ